MKIVFDREAVEGLQKKMDWRSVAHAGREVAYRYTDARRFGAGVLAHEVGVDTPKRVMLVKNSYGADIWHFPGGGLSLKSGFMERLDGKSGIPAKVSRYEDAAARELHEEVNFPVEQVTKFGILTYSYETAGDGRDLYMVFEAQVNDLDESTPLLVPSREIKTVVFVEQAEALEELTLHHAARAGLMALAQPHSS